MGPDEAARKRSISLQLCWHPMIVATPAEGGGIVLATVHCTPSAQGHVARQGVVLTYLLSLVIDSQ